MLFFAIALFIIALGIVLYFDKDTIIDFFKKIWMIKCVQKQNITKTLKG